MKRLVRSSRRRWITILPPERCHSPHRLDQFIDRKWISFGLPPKNDPRLPMTGVFATRSPDRPNPIGLHRVRVVDIDEQRLDVEPLEAIDGTPIIDLKPVWTAADH